MKPTYLITPDADADLRRLVDFMDTVAFDVSPRLVATLLNEFEKLAISPEVGRPVSGQTGQREWLMRFGRGGYVIRYYVHDGTVVVVRLHHSREDRP